MKITVYKDDIVYRCGRHEAMNLVANEGYSYSPNKTPAKAKKQSKAKVKVDADVIKQDEDPIIDFSDIKGDE